MILGLASAAPAEIFRWTDDAGSIHFSDSLHGIPPEHRDRVRVLDDRLPPPRPPERIPLERRGGSYLVDARVNGSTPLRLILDTGATSTLLTPRAARDLGLAVQWTPPIVLQTANGRVEAGWAEVDEIEVGGRGSGPLRVVIHDAVPGADGLLGMNFLGAFRVEIQTSGPSLVLSPP